MNKDSSNSLGKLDKNHQIKRLFSSLLASVFRRSIEEWGDDPRASKEEKNAFISIDVRLLIKLFFYPQYRLFHKDDREETVSTGSSEESADEDSTPKESNDSSVADSTKRRRTSSVRFSPYGIK